MHDWNVKGEKNNCHVHGDAKSQRKMARYKHQVWKVRDDKKGQDQEKKEEKHVNCVPL